MNVIIMNKFDQEIWKVVEGFPTYEVSNRGRLRKFDSKQVLNPGVRNNGYVYTKLSNRSLNTDGTSSLLELERQESAHRLVARAFIDNPLNKPQVNH